MKYETFCASYVKMGPLIIVGIIHDEKNIFGKDYLRCNRGEMPKHPFSPPSTLWKHLMERAENSAEILGNISERQKNISAQEVSKRPEEFLKSDLAKSILDDFDQFG